MRGHSGAVWGTTSGVLDCSGSACSYCQLGQKLSSAAAALKLKLTLKLIHLSDTFYDIDLSNQAVSIIFFIKAKGKDGTGVVLFITC